MLYRMALRLIGRPAWAAPAPGDDPLRDLAADVAARTPDIDHMAPVSLSALLAAHPDRIMLFDVREPCEFDVSHLLNANLIPPKSRNALKQVQDALAGRPDTELALFYCAVGVRSSALASRLRPLDIPGDAVRELKLVNLAGGLFRWANEGLPLVDTNGPTHAVHPFNHHWKQFLTRTATTGYGAR
jgi:rhodanese-related sulfurtransferase